jgi:hypothetical protein
MTLIIRSTLGNCWGIVLLHNYSAIVLINHKTVDIHFVHWLRVNVRQTFTLLPRKMKRLNGKNSKRNYCPTEIQVPTLADLKLPGVISQEISLHDDAIKEANCVNSSVAASGANIWLIHCSCLVNIYLFQFVIYYS